MRASAHDDGAYVTWADCPHCGERNFTLLASKRLDRCASCGRPLVTTPRKALEPRVQEMLDSRRFARKKKNGAPKGAIRTTRLKPTGI